MILTFNLVQLLCLRIVSNQNNKNISKICLLQMFQFDNDFFYLKMFRALAKQKNKMVSINKLLFIFE